MGRGGERGEVRNCLPANVVEQGVGWLGGDGLGTHYAVFTAQHRAGSMGQHEACVKASEAEESLQGKPTTTLLQRLRTHLIPG